MEADLSDLFESSFLLSLELLETLDLFSDIRASESLVLREREDVSDLVCFKGPLLPVMPAAENVMPAAENSELHALLYRSFRLFRVFRFSR